MSFLFKNKKVSTLRLSHNKYKKVQITCLGLSVLVALFCVWQQIDFDSIYGADNITRIPSLGQPKFVKEKTNEQSILLNDPAIKKNWGMLGTGGVADISVDKAWKISQGSKDVIVAIIDTGVDANHVDLKANLWTNPHPNLSKEQRSFSSLFQNENCYNDLHGCNFITNTGDLTDNHGHGTHIAGIVGAEGGNGIGVSGVSPHVSLMILKYYDPNTSGDDNLKNTVRAINYAVDHGATIINYSGGGLSFSQAEYNAIKRARDKGILFVAAAGNERSNSDQTHYYPANYDLDNIISVTAINPEGNVLPSSNYGSNTVDIAAPGENIYSTLPGNRYGVFTGTSQATAFVTGVAALIKANNPDWDYKQVKRQILATSDTRIQILGKTRTAGILNSWAALAIQPATSLSGAIADNSTPILSSTVNSQQIVDSNTRVPALSDQLSQINKLIHSTVEIKTKKLN